MKALPAKTDAGTAPLISSGYSKLNLFGRGVRLQAAAAAARALSALAKEKIEISLITMSDLDISKLRSEDEDTALTVLTAAFAL